jgi:high-affinity nickel-transport protein
MLVALGVASLRPEKRRRVSFYANRKTTPGVVSRHARPLVVGLVHGLAGSAAVTLLMIAAVRDPVWAIAHLGVFGVGTIAGMALITMVMALPFTCAASRADRLGSALRIGAGLVSVVLGLLIAYDSGALFLTV